eukprot:327023-Chlamydomonas_euryale.AAC.1
MYSEERCGAGWCGVPGGKLVVILGKASRGKERDRMVVAGGGGAGGRKLWLGAAVVECGWERLWWSVAGSGCGGVWLGVAAMECGCGGVWLWWSVAGSGCGG